jgi:hypothetical protein
VQTILLLMFSVGVVLIGLGALAIARRRGLDPTRAVIGIVIGIISAIAVIVPRGDTIPDQLEPLLGVVLVGAVTVLLLIGTFARNRR